ALEGESAAGRLLHPATVRLVLDEQSRGVDLVNGLYVRWGIGFALADARTLPWIPEGRLVVWGGWGGSMGVADLGRRLTIAYVMNAMGGDILGSARAAAYVRAVYRALGEWTARRLLPEEEPPRPVGQSREPALTHAS